MAYIKWPTVLRIKNINFSLFLFVVLGSNNKCFWVKGFLFETLISTENVNFKNVRKGFHKPLTPVL